MKNIAVLIPTFRRPEGVVAALSSVLSQCADGSFPIVVAENNLPEADGAAAASRWATEHKVGERLRIVIVDKRGICQNRNAGLAAAFEDPDVDAVAMLDDDAVATPGWLAAIGAAMEHYQADLIGGPTYYYFESQVPSWISKAPMFGVPFHQSGPVRRLRSTNNCTVSRKLYAQLGPELFDPAFDRSGGEDVDMFERAAALGAVTVWASDAVVRELVPSARATERWVLQRHFLSAVNVSRTDVRVKGAFNGAIRQVALAAKELVGGTIRLVSPSAETRFIARLRFYGIAGRLAGLLGHSIEHY